ncbi:MAG: hypothetical protein QXD04_07045, partial [Candidatus Bathyarchaeia archaeon]
YFHGLSKDKQGVKEGVGEAWGKPLGRYQEGPSRGRCRKALIEELEKVSDILAKVPTSEWVRAVRESRDER